MERQGSWRPLALLEMLSTDEGCDIDSIAFDLWVSRYYIAECVSLYRYDITGRAVEAETAS